MGGGEAPLFLAPTIKKAKNSKIRNEKKGTEYSTMQGVGCCITTQQTNQIFVVVRDIYDGRKKKTVLVRCSLGFVRCLAVSFILRRKERIVENG